MLLPRPASTYARLLFQTPGQTPAPQKSCTPVHPFYHCGHLPRLLAQIPLLRTLGAAVMAMTAGRMMANEPIWLRDFFATSTLWYWGFVLGLTLLVLLTGWRRKPAPAPAPDRN